MEELQESGELYEGLYPGKRYFQRIDNHRNLLARFNFSRLKFKSTLRNRNGLLLKTAAIHSLPS